MDQDLSLSSSMSFNTSTLASKLGAMMPLSLMKWHLIHCGSERVPLFMITLVNVDQF